MANSKNRLLTTSEVAEMLHLHPNTVRRWGDSGLLKPCRIGIRGDRRFMEGDVTNLVNSPTYGYK
jgi:excisionase family DNA binding protein